MELSQKLKQARLEAGLSQRALCGEEITRNMLSLIENGSAQPSMKTLSYLAQRLGKPLSYFLEDQARENTDLLASFQVLTQAEAALEEGRDLYAAQLLDRVSAPALQRQSLLLRARMPGADVLSIAAELPSLDPELLLRAKAALDGGDLRRCAGLLGAVEDRGDPAYHLLLGKLQFTRGDYAAARDDLALAEGAFPREAVPLLEIACRELGDYRGAYEYACKLRAL